MKRLEPFKASVYAYGTADPQSPHHAREIVCYRCERDFLAIYPEHAESIVKCPRCGAYPLENPYSVSS